MKACTQEKKWKRLSIFCLNFVTYHWQNANMNRNEKERYCFSFGSWNAMKMTLKTKIKIKMKYLLFLWNVLLMTRIKSRWIEMDKSRVVLVLNLCGLVFRFHKGENKNKKGKMLIYFLIDMYDLFSISCPYKLKWTITDFDIQYMSAGIEIKWRRT